MPNTSKQKNSDAHSPLMNPINMLAGREQKKVELDDLAEVLGYATVTIGDGDKPLEVRVYAASIEHLSEIRLVLGKAVAKLEAFFAAERNRGDDHLYWHALADLLLSVVVVELPQLIYGSCDHDIHGWPHYHVCKIAKAWVEITLGKDGAHLKEWDDLVGDLTEHLGGERKTIGALLSEHSSPNASPEEGSPTKSPDGPQGSSESSSKEPGGSRPTQTSETQ